MERLKSFIPINWELVANPVNWAIILLMVLLAGVALKLVADQMQSANSTVRNGD